MALEQQQKKHRFPQGLTLEQERTTRAIECPYCGMLVFWNTRAIHRKIGKPMICDAVNGGPRFNQGHYCAILLEQRREQKYLQESLDNFLASVRLSTAIAILGDKVVVNDKGNKVIINENIVFKKRGRIKHIGTT